MRRYQYHETVACECRVKCGQPVRLPVTFQLLANLLRNLFERACETADKHARRQRADIGLLTGPYAVHKHEPVRTFQTMQSHKPLNVPTLMWVTLIIRGWRKAQQLAVQPIETRVLPRFVGARRKAPHAKMLEGPQTPLVHPRQRRARQGRRKRREHMRQMVEGLALHAVTCEACSEGAAAVSSEP